MVVTEVYVASLDTSKEEPFTVLLSLGPRFSEELSNRLRDVFLIARSMVTPYVYLN